jgi:hypothetical protein
MTKSKEISKESITPKETPEWLKQFKTESLENAVKEDILPTWKPYTNTVHKVKLLSEPKLVEIPGKKGFYSINIERDGMKFNMNLNKSFLFQLGVIMKKNKLDSIIGKEIVLTKNTEGYFSLQLL